MTIFVFNWNWNERFDKVNWFYSTYQCAGTSNAYIVFFMHFALGLITKRTFRREPTQATKIHTSCSIPFYFDLKNQLYFKKVSLSVKINKGGLNCLVKDCLLVFELMDSCPCAYAPNLAHTILTFMLNFGICCS